MFFFIQNGHSIHFKLLAPTDQDLNQLKNNWIFIIATSVAAAINRSVLITVVLLKLVSHDKRLTWCWSEQDHDSFGIPMSLDDSSLRCTCLERCGPESFFIRLSIITTDGGWPYDCVVHRYAACTMLMNIALFPLIPTYIDGIIKKKVEIMFSFIGRTRLVLKYSNPSNSRPFCIIQ